MTWGENNKKGYVDRKLGKFDNVTKAVLQLSLEGKLLKEFCSISEAVRQTGVKNISKVCRGINSTAGGFKWQYKE